MRRITTLFAVVLVALGAQSCGDTTGNDDSGTNNSTNGSTNNDTDSGSNGKGDEANNRAPEFDFAFRAEEPDEYTVKTDHLGVSLLSTVLRQRSDRYNCRGVNNQAELLAMYDGVVNVHRMWGDEIQAEGFELCVVENSDGDEPTSDNIVDFLRAVPCTTQRASRTLPDGTFIEGPRVIDLITPDFATIDVDEPGGFPNGRKPQDQVTDLILAMGLVKIDEEMTLDQVQLNPQENDVPFPDEFPWLAPYHPELP